jgi:hypothetical protein
MPNDRERALMIWYLIILGAVVVKSPDIRRSTWHLPRQVPHWKIALSIIGTLAYMSLEGWVGFQMGIWGWSPTTDTAFLVLRRRAHGAPECQRLEDGVIVPICQSVNI